MASQISMVAAEYQVRAITSDQFIVIYTRGSTTVKAWLARFLRMFNSSTSPNPPPKSMASQISMVAAEYQVRAITGHQFIILYTCGSTTVKAWFARFLRMFNSSKDRWVAGLDVEYTIVLESEKILKEAEKKKPAVI